MRKLLIPALGLVLAAPAFAAATTYELDPAHSAAHFSVKHMMVSNVRGEISGVKGTVSLDDKSLKTSTVEVTLDVSTINTREPKRDAHLKSADFFDVAKNPTITFKSTSITAAGKEKYKVVGDLTMHGETHPATLAVTATGSVKDMMGTPRRGFEATTKLSRKTWALTWNKALEAGGVAVGDEVTVTIDGELVEKTDSTAAKATATTPSTAGAKATTGSPTPAKDAKAATPAK